MLNRFILPVHKEFAICRFLFPFGALFIHMFLTSVAQSAQASM